MGRDRWCGRRFVHAVGRVIMQRKRNPKRKRHLRAGTVAWGAMKRRAARIADIRGYTSPRDPWTRAMQEGKR